MCHDAILPNLPCVPTAVLDALSITPDTLPDVYRVLRVEHMPDDALPSTADLALFTALGVAPDDAFAFAVVLRRTSPGRQTLGALRDLAECRQVMMSDVTFAEWEAIVLLDAAVDLPDVGLAQADAFPQTVRALLALPAYAALDPAQAQRLLTQLTALSPLQRLFVTRAAASAATRYFDEGAPLATVLRTVGLTR